MGAVLGYATLALVVAAVVHYVAEPVLLVPDGYAVVVERLGAVVRVLHPGRHFIWPLLERVRRVRWTYVEAVDASGQPLGGSGAGAKKDLMDDRFVQTRTRLYALPPIHCCSEDGWRATISLVVGYAITDVLVAVTQAPDDLYLTLETDLESALSAVVRSLAAEALHAAKLEERMRTAVGEKSWGKQYGAKLTQCTVRSVEVDWRRGARGEAARGAADSAFGCGSPTATPPAHSRSWPSWRRRRGWRCGAASSRWSSRGTSWRWRSARSPTPACARRFATSRRSPRWSPTLSCSPNAACRPSFCATTTTRATGASRSFSTTSSAPCAALPAAGGGTAGVFDAKATDNLF